MMDDMFAKLMQQSQHIVPFLSIVGGKPKLNTARVLELGILLGVLWWRMDIIDNKVDKIETAQAAIKIEVTEQRVKLENITSLTINMEQDVEDIKKKVYGSSR